MNTEQTLMRSDIPLDKVFLLFRLLRNSNKKLND